MNTQDTIAKLRHLVASQHYIEARNLSFELTQHHPRNATFWRMRGELHLRLKEFDSAIECIYRVIAASLPLSRETIIELYHVLGTTYFKAGRIHDAIQALDQVIAVDPEYADARILRAMAYSLLGDFERGWPDYEYRRRHKLFSTSPRFVPTWDGGSLNGKTIMVYAEQGHGDTIQFVRYLPRVKELGGTVIFASQPSLTRLLFSCTGADRVIGDGDLTPIHDLEIPLMSLMGIFQTRLNTIPGETPYLKSPISAGEQPRRIIAKHKNKFCVGLAWQGNTHRTLSLKSFSELLAVESMTFFSLQKGDAAMEIESVVPNSIIDLGQYFDDFADTAAAIQEVDLVISIDTSVAHLAGALGKPIWTLIPFVPDWRWMLEREDSPWYPTMRLFRQPAPGDWDSVIKRVAAELKSLVEAK